MKITLIAVLALVLASVSHAQDSLLSLAEAEQLALQNDFVLKRLTNEKHSQQESAQAALNWDDPTIQFGVNNLPLDSLSFDQEAMTQLKVGIAQKLPQGDSLSIRSKQLQFAAQEKDYEAQLRMRQVLKSLRLRWLDIIFQEQAYTLLQNTYQLFEESRDLIEFSYASGRGDQQDIYQTELELSLLVDKLSDNRMQTQVALDALNRWTGVEWLSQQVAQDTILLTHRPLFETEQMKQRLQNHPSLLKMTQLQEQSRQGIKLSLQKYKPAWAVDVSYGKRFGDNADGSRRSDFFSTMVKMKYPLWGKQKQDHQLAASEYQLSAVDSGYANQLLELKNELRQTNTQIQQLESRIRNYQENILDKAAQNAQAALNAYQAGVGRFNEVVRSNVTQLNIEIALLKLRIELARQYVNLVYLLGDA